MEPKRLLSQKNIHLSEGTFTPRKVFCALVPSIVDEAWILIGDVWNLFAEVQNLVALQTV